MKEKDFNQKTMQMATAQDVFRMWRKLWDDLEPGDVSAKTLNAYMYGAEVLDNTQYFFVGQELVKQ